MCLQCYICYNKDSVDQTNTLHKCIIGDETQYITTDSNI